MQQAVGGEWELGTFRRTMRWIAPAVAAVIAVVGVVVVLDGQRRPSVFVAIWLVFWLAICTQIAVLFVREVTRIVVGPDGSVVAHRAWGTVHTHANRVSRIGYGWWVTGNQYGGRPAKICTVDGNLRLAQGFPGVFDVATAIRAHNPGVPIEL